MSMRAIILSLMPKAMKQRAEAESRQWKATCPRCGGVNSIWDLGGIRYLAAGSPAKRLKCPQCGKIDTHTFTKQ
jgi:phage FluMu protein Com